MNNFIKILLSSGLIAIFAVSGIFAEDFSLLRHEDPTERSREARRLGEINVSSAVPELINLLEDDVPGVRINAIVALGKIGDEKAIEPLKNILNNDPLPAARIMAAEALGNYENNVVENELLEAAESENINIRAAAMKSLGESGGRKEIDKLIEKAENDPHWSVRESAVKALLKIAEKKKDNKEEIKKVIKQISKKDKNTRVGNSAKKAIKKLEKSSEEQDKGGWWIF